jgi:hypothetical protein
MTLTNVSVPLLASDRIALGGETRTNWPAVSITNETDPVFTASVAADISGADTDAWHKAASDGISATTDVAALQGQVSALEGATNNLNTTQGLLIAATNALDIRVGALDDATNAINTRVGALEVPYQAWTVVTSGDGGTATIAYANGSLVYIEATTDPTTITFDNSTYNLTNGVYRVGVEVVAGTNTIAFENGVVSNESAVTFTSPVPKSLFYRKSGTNTLWRGRQ